MSIVSRDPYSLKRGSKELTQLFRKTHIKVHADMRAFFRTTGIGSKTIGGKTYNLSQALSKGKHWISPRYTKQELIDACREYYKSLKNPKWEKLFDEELSILGLK